MQLTQVFHNIFESVLSNAFPCVLLDFEYTGDTVLQMRVQFLQNTRGIFRREQDLSL